MLKTELLRMKERCGLTNEEISKASLIALQTVNNVFSGRTQDPGYSTVAALVKAMRGSMDDIEGLLTHHEHHGQDKITPCVKCQEKLERIRELYERMVASSNETIKAQSADLKEREKTFEKIQKEHEKVVEQKNKWITALFVICGIAVATFLVMVILDVLLPTIGWITY